MPRPDASHPPEILDGARGVIRLDHGDTPWPLANRLGIPRGLRDLSAPDLSHFQSPVRLSGTR